MINPSTFSTHLTFFTKNNCAQIKGVNTEWNSIQAFTLTLLPPNGNISNHTVPCAVTFKKKDLLDIAFGVTLISSVNIMSYIVSSPSWPMLLA